MVMDDLRMVPGKLHSVFQAETFVALMGADELWTEETVGKEAYICSDRKAVSAFVTRNNIQACEIVQETPKPNRTESYLKRSK